jgi:hypothetical protein
MLKERYPTMKFIFTQSFGSPNAKSTPTKSAPSATRGVRGRQEAITQGRRDVGVFMERAGKPGVSICSEVLVPAKRALADLQRASRPRA